MTVLSEESRKEYVGNGTLDTYVYTWQIYTKDDNKVYVAGVLKTVDIHYTVTGVLNPDGGNIIFTAGNIPANLASIVIYLDLPLTQGIDYKETDKFPAETHEKGLDRLTKIAQSLKEKLYRCLKLPSYSVGSGELPTDFIPNYFLKVNSMGKGFELHGGLPYSSPAGANKEVQINDNGVLGADPDLTWDKTTERLYAKDLMVKGPWVDVRNYVSINVAITAIGASVTTLLIPNAQITAGNVTIPSTLTLKILNGGSIVHTHPDILTINGPFEAGLYQVFSGFSAGDVTFGANSIKEAYPQWWGTDVAAFRCAIASIVTNIKRVYVPKGIYTFTSTLDFSTYFGASPHYGFEFICHPDAEFKANDVGVNPVVNLRTTAGGQFIYSKFQFGHINGNGLAVDGITFGPTNNSTIIINEALSCTGATGIKFWILDTDALGIFNNLIFINAASFNAHGIVIRSQSTPPYGVQANQFHVGLLFQNSSNGLLVGGDGAFDVSDRNIFYIGDTEGNGAYGVRDWSGGNLYFIGASIQNTTAGFRLEASADFTKVEGSRQDATYFSDATNGRLMVNGIHGPITLAVNSATPSVGKQIIAECCGMFIPTNFVCANTAATTITLFSGGVPGQIITVRIDANTTIQNNANMLLKGGANFSGDSADMIMLQYVATNAWREISRSTN
jgi:hypothetical protein